MYRIFYCEECNKHFKLKFNSHTTCECGVEMQRIYDSSILTKVIQFTQTKEDLILDLRKDLEDNKKKFKNELEEL